MKIPLPPRRLIPKWRPVASTLKVAESSAILKRTPCEFSGNEDEFNKAVALWRETKAPGVLGDVLSFSVHPELHEKAIRIGEEALQIGAKVTDTQVSLIRDIKEEPVIISHDKLFPFQRNVQKLRDILRNTPDNPLVLLDYAQYQLAAGKPKSAGRALRTALSIVPNNRMALRTYARYLVHINEKEQALKIIQRHVCTPHDPWLMASEIALASAAETQSRFIMPGRNILSGRHDIHPMHLTELAGAIALEELHSGRMKRARHNQMLALASPNDNVVAQAVSFRQEFGIDLNTQAIHSALMSSSEALTLNAMLDLQPHKMYQYAADWHDEEPFSSRPVHLMAISMAYAGDFSCALQWVRTGLLADPADPGLLISLAYNQARLGYFEESYTTMRRLLHINKDALPYCMATSGLIEYCKGNYEAGDALYNSAAAKFYQIKRPDLSTFCLINQMFAAMDYNHPGVANIIANAQSSLKAHPSPDALLLLNSRSDHDVITKPESSKQRLISQWVFDPATNTLMENRGLTKPGAQPLVILQREGR